MKHRPRTLRRTTALLFTAALATADASRADPATQPVSQPAVRARIDAAETLPPIAPELYGMFVEHARDLVYRSMWSEVLDDRKFYNPVVPARPDAPPTPATRPGGRNRGPGMRRWTPVGPAEAVVMDTNHAFVGAQSPAIVLDANTPHGVQQSGVPVLAKAYTGRIVLAGEPGAVVTVTLAWGPGEADHQSVRIDGLTADYRAFPLRFTCPVEAAARFEVSAVGSGTLRIGAVSLMPADNVQGWRPEVIDVLRSLRSGVYRWPGGNFVSAHDWRDAIGPIDQRPPVFDPVWNALQSNDVGTDEFMTFCRMIGVEPYITVNAGFGDARSAAEYVEYANAPATTRMGAMRAANGHPDPYHVKYWGIGNEMWGDYQYGYMPLDQYIHKHNQFAAAMRRVDPNVVLIGSGAMPDTMTGAKQALKLGDKLVPDYLGPADWTGQMLLRCAGNMDLISEHFYNFGNTHMDLSQGAKQVPNDPGEPLSDWMRRPANHVRLKYEEYEEYLNRIPALKSKPVPIALDEYAYTGPGYKVVPAYAWNFHEMFRHTDAYRTATLTFATATYSTAHGQAALSPTGVLFKLYRDHFGVLPVRVTGNSPQPKPTDPIGGEQPAVNAGSDTFPLDVVAAWSGDRKRLTVAVVNPTDAEQTLSWQIDGASLSGKGTLYRLAPDTLSADNVIGKEPAVVVQTSRLDGMPLQPRFAPFSVAIYEFETR